MNSYGKAETKRLKENLESQLVRLVNQLQDLENCREEMDPDEYEETKDDTMQQLKELNLTLKKLVKGDISLISSLGAMQLATQAAISEAFKTPEVIRLFGQREPKRLRQRLVSLEHQHKLNKLSLEALDQQKGEILIALRQLGEQLSAEELIFLEAHDDISKAFKNMEFVEVDE